MFKTVVFASSIMYAIADDNGKQKCIDNSDCLDYLTHLKTEFNEYNQQTCANIATGNVSSDVTETTLPTVKQNCLENNDCEEYLNYIIKEFNSHKNQCNDDTQEASNDESTAGEASNVESNAEESGNDDTQEASNDESNAGEASNDESTAQEASNDESNAGEASNDESNAEESVNDESTAQEANNDATEETQVYDPDNLHKYIYPTNSDGNCPPKFGYIKKGSCQAFEAGVDTYFDENFQSVTYTEENLPNCDYEYSGLTKYGDATTVSCFVKGQGMRDGCKFVESDTEGACINCYAYKPGIAYNNNEDTSGCQDHYDYESQSYGTIDDAVNRGDLDQANVGVDAFEKPSYVG